MRGMAMVEAGGGAAGMRQSVGSVCRSVERRSSGPPLIDRYRAPPPPHPTNPTVTFPPPKPSHTIPTTTTTPTQHQHQHPQQQHPPSNQNRHGLGTAAGDPLRDPGLLQLFRGAPGPAGGGVPALRPRVGGQWDGAFLFVCFSYIYVCVFVVFTGGWGKVVVLVGGSGTVRGWFCSFMWSVGGKLAQNKREHPCVCTGCI
jgi:hypothetical protein